MDVELLQLQCIIEAKDRELASLRSAFSQQASEASVPMSQESRYLPCSCYNMISCGVHIVSQADLHREVDLLKDELRRLKASGSTRAIETGEAMSGLNTNSVSHAVDVLS